MTAAPVPKEALRIFISYSRSDQGLADVLVRALEERNFEVLIDRRDMPYGEEWQKELADFIRSSDTVVWLVSSDSIASRWVNWELGEVVRLNKRLVPVRIRDVDLAELPEALGKIHVLPSEEVFALELHLPALIDTLNTNRAWLKEATRLADRARQWQAKQRGGELLLRGVALKDAELWAAQQPKAAPAPASEILELILASKQGAARRQWIAVGGALVVAALSTGLAVFAWTQWRRAEQELRASNAQRLAAEGQAALQASLREGAPGAPDVQRGVLLALESLKLQPNIQADGVLREGLRRLPGTSHELALEVDDELRVLGPRAAWIAIRRGEGDVVFDSTTRAFRAPSPTEAELIAERERSRAEAELIAERERERSRAEAAETAFVAESPDGRFAVVESQQGLGEWIFASLELVRRSDRETLTVLPHDWHIREAMFSKSGDLLLTVTGRVSMDASDPSATRLVGSTVYVWAVPSGRKLSEVSFAHRGGITQLEFDRDGDWMALQTSDAAGQTLIVMPIWPDLVRSEACRTLTRNLSPSEWATFVMTSSSTETCPGLPQVSE